MVEGEAVGTFDKARQVGDGFSFDQRHRHAGNGAPLFLAGNKLAADNAVAEKEAPSGIDRSINDLAEYRGGFGACDEVATIVKRAPHQEYQLVVCMGLECAGQFIKPLVGKNLD